MMNFDWVATIGFPILLVDWLTIPKYALGLEKGKFIVSAKTVQLRTKDQEN